MAQFEAFKARLTPSGMMAHSTPCYHYLYPTTRFHMLFLTGRSAEVLADRTGFHIRSRQDEGEYVNVVYEQL